MKQNQKEILLPSFIISQFTYCFFICMFCSKKSTKMTNAVHERSSRINLNDYESPQPLLLEQAHHLTFHLRCINSLMIEFYKYLNGHSPMNDIFKLRENMYNLRNFHIFQPENRLLKYGLDAIPYRASQLQQLVSTDIREAASFAFLKNLMKTWKCEDCACRSCKIFIQNVRYV